MQTILTLLGDIYFQLQETKVQKDNNHRLLFSSSPPPPTQLEVLKTHKHTTKQLVVYLGGDFIAGYLSTIISTFTSDT